MVSNAANTTKTKFTPLQSSSLVEYDTCKGFGCSKKCHPMNITVDRAMPILTTGKICSLNGNQDINTIVITGRKNFQK